MPLITTTPPDQLVRSFHFVTAPGPRPTFPSPPSSRISQDRKDFSERTSAASRLKSNLVKVDLEGSVKAWEGRVVFSDEPSSAQIRQPEAGPSGRSTSPISITSSPERLFNELEGPLPRPRAKIRYSTTISTTAYTPPRPSASILVEDNSVQAKVNATKPIHPFFSRDSRRAKSVPLSQPKPQRPRFVAHYSSTSANTSHQASQESKDTEEDSLGLGQDRSSSEWRVSKTKEVELVTHQFGAFKFESSDAKGGEEDGPLPGPAIPPEAPTQAARLDELAAMLADLSIPPLQGREKLSRLDAPTTTRKPLTIPPTLPLGPTSMPATSKSKPSKLSKQTNAKTVKGTVKPLERRPAPMSTPSPPTYFHYSNLRNPPRIVYTSDPNETNDLLSCLTGNVLGFDMEWPMAGSSLGAGKRLGMKYDAERKKMRFVQPPVALMQFCDEHLVVLVHVWNMKQLPEKIIEVLSDRKIHKIGVAIRGDGQKLYRDYPTSFPDGINSLLELNNFARHVDPVHMGPGRMLTSMAKLVKGFLDIHLNKEDGVRKGQWMDGLDQIQRDYAANDVVVSMELFKRFTQIAEKNGKVDIDLKTISFDLTPNPGSPSSAARAIPTAPRPIIVDAAIDPEDPTPLSVPVSVSASIPGPKEPKPSEWRALSAFKQGLTIAEIAAAGSVQTVTIESYIVKALDVLPSDVLSLDHKKRFMGEISPESRVWEFYRGPMKRLKREIGEAVSDSEEEEVERVE